MTTGLQFAILGGVILGAGIALLVWRLVPAQADLADVVHRNSPEGVREHAAVASAAGATGRTDRLGLWAMRRFPARWWSRTPTKELALLQIPVHRHYGTKVMFAGIGLVAPPVLSYVAAVSGGEAPFLFTGVGSIVAAVGLFMVPDAEVRQDAAKARREFTLALGSYVDLVALERLGGAGTRQAMERAAEIGDSWVFRRVSEELARSRWSGVAPWDALAALADELDLPELVDLADVVRLTKEGARVYEQLRARSDGMRSAMLNDELSKANSASERMTVPMSLLAIVFIAILIGPNLLTLSASS